MFHLKRHTCHGSVHYQDENHINFGVQFQYYTIKIDPKRAKSVSLLKIYSQFFSITFPMHCRASTVAINLKFDFVELSFDSDQPMIGRIHLALSHLKEIIDMFNSGRFLYYDFNTVVHK
jgi:hypothetical protein